MVLNRSEILNRIIEGHLDDIQRWVRTDDFESLVQWIEDVLALDQEDSTALVSDYKCYFSDLEIEEVLND